MKKQSLQDRVVCRNRKATHQYELLEKLECGIELRGTEVKSLRERQASLDEAYVRIEEGQLWLIGCHIAAYKHGSTMNHEPDRRRRLLIHRRELQKWEPKVRQKGLTIVPLRIYFSDRGLAKIEVAIARGKAAHDKRQDIKAREDKREMDRSQKRYG